VPFPLTVFPEAFLIDLTYPIFSSQSQFHGVRLRLQNFPRIQWAIFVADTRGCPKRVFHWSAAWSSWQPLWWGVISFQNFRSLKLGLYFCMDFLTSSELIGYIDLTNSWNLDKMFLGYQCEKGCEAFFIFKMLLLLRALMWLTKIGEYSIRQFQDRFFRQAIGILKKASHPFVVYHLLIDIVQSVWSYLRAGRRVIQFNK